MLWCNQGFDSSQAALCSNLEQVVCTCMHTCVHTCVPLSPSSVIGVGMRAVMPNTKDT